MMVDTPIAQQGPYKLVHEQGHWVIVGQDSVPLCELTGQLLDGSGRMSKYPDGVIRTAEARQAEAEFVLAAVNAEWLLHYGGPRR
jgi:hypothetical protein